jgi:MFS family permease
MAPLSVTRLRAGLRSLPRQFWLLTAGIFIFLIGIDMCFPFETLYLNKRLGISMSTIGLIIGSMSFIGLPFQIPGGALTDRIGRRPMIVVGIVGTMLLYLGVAFAPALWVIVLVFGIEAAFGWSMFLTASNAMVADLVPFERRAEAYSLIRTAVSAGATIGPLFAAWILASSGSFRLSFVIGTGVCGLFALMVIVLFKETKPDPGSRSGAAAAEAADNRAADGGPLAPADPHERFFSECEEPGLSAPPQPAPPLECPTLPDDRPARRGGYRQVLRDRRFLLLMLATLAPSYCFAQIWVTLPVLLNDLYGVRPASWALLLSVYSLTSAVIQFPVVRALRRRDPTGLIGIGSLLIGSALGGIAFAGWGWPTVALMVVTALGVVLFMALVPTVVSHLAPVHLRGRYMGVWTIVYVAGYGLGPLLGGRALDTLGPQSAYLVVAAVGVAGSLLFTGLALVQRRAAGGAAVPG